MIKNVEALAAFLEQKLRAFTDLAVVGTSGGVDSSVVASIAVKALGKDSVYLVSMPYDSIDVTTFNARSAQISKALGAHHYEVPIGESCTALEREIAICFPSSALAVLTKANLRPRVRMNVLYSICGQLNIDLGKRCRVIGTGHLSEDLIGYDTKGGDALADIFILSDLVKSEVYQLADYYEVPESIVEAEPSAGLYPGQTDFQELGFTYSELEPATLALFKCLSRGLSLNDLKPELTEFQGLPRNFVEFVLSRYKAHYHKHQAPVTVSCRKPEWFVA